MSHLRFHRVRVRRMPGFPEGDFTLDELSSGVNVVFGPNASGKTTTARALESLLWPEAAAPPRSLIHGEFEIEGSRWRVDVESRHATYQRDGSAATAPPLPPAEARHRYRLPLHELFEADNRPFAEAILRESAGGYDVAEAVRRLGFRDALPGRRAEADAVRRAREREREARRRQEELERQAAHAAELETRLREADAARSRIELLERALARHEARRGCADARLALEAFPPGMESVRGDEADRLERLRERADDARRQASGRLGAAREAAEARAGTGFVAPPPGDLVPSLRARVEELRAMDDRMADAEERRRGAAAKRDEARRVLGGSVSDEALRRLGRVEMEELADLARAAERVRAARAAAEADRDRLADADEPPEAARLEEGVRLLRRWLRSPRAAAAPERRTALLAVAGAALAVVTGALGAWLVHVGFLAAVAAAAVLVLLAIRWWPAARPDGERERREYESIGLEGPADWSPSTVERHLIDLEIRLAAARLAEERHRRRAEALNALADIAREADDLERRRVETAARLGLAPDLSEPTLYVLANRISRWQDAEAETREAEEAVEDARRIRAAALDRVGAALEPFGFPAPAATAEAAGALEDLIRRIRDFEKASADHDRARDDADRFTEEAARAESEAAELFARLGLEPGAVSAVADRCERLEAFREARAAAEVALDRLRQADDRLREHPAFDDGLLEADLADVEAMLEAARRTAEPRDELAKRIAEIGARVADAKAGHDLEAALADVDAALAQLAALRDREVGLATGWELAEFVRARTRDHARPDVFARARDLFAAITAHAYDLDLDDDAESPAFRAFDRRTGVGHALDELSSATRIQLLVAVRLAFVEAGETGARPPLFLDETLANSDDLRARALMEAMAALARDGRQIFYFTAQTDEVGKWLALLQSAAEPVPFTILDLARARRMTGWDDGPRLDVAPAPTPELPDPSVHDHASFGRALPVPPLETRAERIGRTHLWYLVEDTESLHNLLALGVETWGQLHGLVEDQGSNSLIGRDMYIRISSAARTLERVLELGDVGRGRAVDRQALLDSEAVTATFIDRVSALAASLDGDAAALLAALDEVPRFLNRNKERLREFLEEHGYLDGRARLPAEEIRARVLVEMADEVRAGRIDPARVDRFLAWLGRTE